LETLKAAVFVTTDKVYENKEWVYPYRENDALGGHDPYSASKAASELAIASYRDSFLEAQGIRIASARAGNVIGGGDWSSNRLIPDAVRAWQAGQTLTVRLPNAVRPWQHVLDPLAGYLRLAEQLWHSTNLAGAFNFGPKTNEVATVQTLVELARASFGQGNVEFGDGIDGPHEAGLLSLDISKAHKLLRVKPLWTLAQAVHQSINWYKANHLGADARDLCLKDIATYESSV
jgi:CDP-glucose 4,6-dehydratase